MEGLFDENIKVSIVGLYLKISGCWVDGMFLGLFGYSDDNVCVAPSLNALQDMEFVWTRCSHH